MPPKLIEEKQKLAMDKKLYEASMQGNVASLLNLLHEDPLIIHKYISKPHHTETPLHIATLLGHVDFVKEILTRKPDLTHEPDSEGSTTLHLASAIGHVEIVRCLLKADIETCAALDRYGMNPVHVAAMKGRVNALWEMMRVRPDAARMVTGDGSTILHLCVKYNQFEAIKFIVEVGGVVDEEFVNFKDQEGNTVLHLAVLDKQAQSVNFLLSSTNINTESQNVYGLTASDISKLHSNHIISRDKHSRIMIIEEALWQHRCQSSARLISNSNSSIRNVIIPSANDQNQNQNQNRPLSPLELILDRLLKKQEERLSHSIDKRKEQQAENRRNTIIIAATVITSMSFQVAANPPGGVWQDTSGTHVAGQAIMASVSPVGYKLFIVLNTIAFCGSAFVFLLLLSRLTFLTSNKFVMGALNVALWIAILSSAICFTFCVMVTTPVAKMSVAFQSANAVMYISCVMWGVIFIGHISRFIWKRAQRFNTSTRNSHQPLDQGIGRA